MGPLDVENARVLEGHLAKHGVTVIFSGATGFKKTEDGALAVETDSGKDYKADIVILAIGVRPDIALAKMAGIEIGERGGIRVNEHMSTSDPDIFAVGDAVEVKDFVTGEWSLVAIGRSSESSG